MKTAVIAGYTGLTGSHLLPLLLADSRYGRVVAAGRRAPQLHHPRLEYRSVDFDHLQLDLDRVDEVFCCLGTTMKKAGSREYFRLVDFQYPLNLARACRARNARQFLVITSMGAGRQSPFFYNRVKGELEEALATLGYLRLDILRPSLLLGRRPESRPAERLGQIVMRAAGFLFRGPLKNYRAIPASRVAIAMQVLAGRPEEGVFIHLSGQLLKPETI